MQKAIDQRVQRPVNWRGRSGRCYAVLPRRFDDFALEEGRLYLLALGNHVLWAGSAEDVVGDAASRAGFRLALDCADRVFEVEGGDNAVERLTIMWDLHGAEPVMELSAA